MNHTRVSWRVPLRLLSLGALRCVAWVVALGYFGVLTPVLSHAQARDIPDSAAIRYVGQTVRVTGTVWSVQVAADSTIFLNFGGPVPNQAFTAVIAPSAAWKFPWPRQWERRRARVTGLVRRYRGRPAILLEEQSQLFGWRVSPAE